MPTLVPKLRFPEFSNADKWQADKLGSVADFVNEKIPLERIELSSYVSTENILADYGGVTRASKLPSTGSVTRYRPNDTLVSNIRPYLKKVWVANREGGASNDVIVIRAKQRLLPEYFSCLLRNDAFIDYVMTGAKGVKMPRGDIASMKEYPTFFPPKPEQQKIAECLSSVDEWMAAQARKVDALKIHKKGLMQQLFPREGETQPCRRFPEFRNFGEWEVKKLGAKANKVGSGITPTGGDKNYKQSGRPFVRSQNVGWGVLLLDDAAYIDEETHASFDSSEIKVRDVLLNITGASIGRSAVADDRIAGGNVNQHVCIIRTKTFELNPLFLNQFLISQRGQKQIDSFQAGGNRQGLNFAQIRSFGIPLPPALAEQQRIAACLSSLDELITAETQKLEALKTHKQGLMQQLFPSPVEVEA
ncbi:MAG: hypothetical protein DCF23_11600 [Cyanobium sp.]|nr:MAG: hypothetical protein DCF23_11600 [Cyanobium sp.]